MTDQNISVDVLNHYVTRNNEDPGPLASLTMAPVMFSNHRPLLTCVEIVSRKRTLLRLLLIVAGLLHCSFLCLFPG